MLSALIDFLERPEAHACVWDNGELYVACSATIAAPPADDTAG